MSRALTAVPRGGARAVSGLIVSRSELAQLKARDVCYGAPIVGLTGINGAGKTLLAVQSAIYDMATGREVYSTVTIESKYGNSKPIQTLRQLLELRDVTILLDEVSVILPSSSGGALPQEFDIFLQVMRHRGITFRWTAPAWMRANNKLRDVTQVAVNVIPFFKWGGGLWPSPRLVLAGVLDTTQGKTDAAPDRVLKRKALLPRRLQAFGSYDTLADTPQLRGAMSGGVCIDCGGSQERAKHSKQRHEAMGIPFYETDVITHQRAAPVTPRTFVIVPTTDETPA